MTDFVQAGFDYACWGEEEPYIGPRAKQQQRKFNYGLTVGMDVLRECGGIVGLREVLKETPERRKLALKLHKIIISSIERAAEAEKAKLLPDETYKSQRLDAETRKLLDAAELEPCAECRNIAICAVTARTCSLYRGYAGHRFGRYNQVPDMSFADSFPVKARDGRPSKEEERMTWQTLNAAQSVEAHSLLANFIKTQQATSSPSASPVSDIKLHGESSSSAQPL